MQWCFSISDTNALGTLSNSPARCLFQSLAVILGLLQMLCFDLLPVEKNESVKVHANTSGSVEHEKLPFMGEEYQNFQ